MSSKKIGTIIPLFLAPNPKDFDELCPIARQGMNALELQYANIINAFSNNNHGTQNFEPDIICLSPIPCLEDSDQWDNIQITIDTGSRRNKKLIAQSNQNIEQILGKVRSDVEDLNLNRIGIDISTTSEEQDETKVKEDETKVKENKIDLKDFEFTRKKQKVLPKCRNTLKSVTNESDITFLPKEIGESADTSKNTNIEPEQVQNSSIIVERRKVSRPCLNLDQFAYKPRSKTVVNEQENGKSNNIIVNNAAKGSEPVDVAKNDENNYTNYVPSDDSSNMSFSQESAANVHLQNIVIDETPAGKILTLKALDQKYNKTSSTITSNYCSHGKQNQNHLNAERKEPIIIDDTPLCKQRPTLEFLRDKNTSYLSYDDFFGRLDKNNKATPKRNRNKVVMETKDGKRKINNGTNEQNVTGQVQQGTGVSALELLSQIYGSESVESESNESCLADQNRPQNLDKDQIFVYKTPQINANISELNIMSEAPQCKQISYLDLLTKQFNENKVKLNGENCGSLNNEIHNMEYIVHRSVSERTFCIMNKQQTSTGDAINQEQAELSGKEDCLNKTLINNKIEYVEKWLKDLPDRDLKDKMFEQYDEMMDVDNKLGSQSKMNKVLGSVCNPNTLTNSKVLEPETVNTISKTERSKTNNETIEPNVNPNQNDPGDKQKITEGGIEYVEDWFKDMPEEYLKIKNLFDFDNSKVPMPQNPCEIKENPFLPPKPVRKSNKIKTVQRKTYVLEIDKGKPEPEPKRVQTKITSLFRPVMVDNSALQIESKPRIAQNVHSTENVNNSTKTGPRKRRITDHFTVEKNIDKKGKLEEKQEEFRNGYLGPKFIKKKHKFFTPVLSQLVEKEVKYEMYTVDDTMAGQMETYIKQNIPHEICFNIVYKDGFCQLSQPKKTGNVMYSPNGIMMHVSWLTQKLNKTYFTEFYHLNLSKMFWKDFQVPRSLIKTCLTINCRKVCFKAQTLFVVLMNTFSFTPEEVSLEWLVLDPFVGCWVLDPDHPPTTFQGVQSQLTTRPNYKVTTSDVLIKSCDMLIQLSETTLKLQNRLEERDLWTIFVEMEMKIVSILAVMEHRGISTNVNILKTFSKALKEKLEAVEQKAHNIVGRKFQLNSPLQVRSILYNELKLDSANCIEIKETAASGVKSTSEPMLQLLRRVHPLPGLILEYRHLQKAKSTFVDSMLQHVQNGMIKSTWEHTAAATGRIASSNPNLQAIPKHPFPLILFPENGDISGAATLRLRNAYASQPGYTLLAADFQQIELRVFAHLSGDESIIDSLNSPGDIFMNMTKSWLGNKVQVIAAEHREQTKKIVYATIYGAGAGKLADILSVPFEQATTILRDFSNKFPSLREFSINTIEQCRIQGYLTSLSGRCRLFPNINSPIFGLKAQSERQAVNFLIQGSAADICKAAMICTEEKLKRLNCKLLLQIHDELVWEVLDSELEQVKSIVRHVMEDTSTMCGRLIKLSVPLPVSISVGKRWGDMN